jgi:lipopolysaccharide transport system permease protein
MFLSDYRELYKSLVISDLKLKYASYALGFDWSMLNPLMIMLILYFVFSMYRDGFIYGTLPVINDIMIIELFALGFMAAGTAVFSKLSGRFAEGV